MNQPGPRVLVVVASRHGATAEIAEALAHDLAECPAGATAGITARAVAANAAPAPDRFDAVVLGSAVYVGRWQEDARNYAVTHATALRRLPVWLFSSGPIGEPPFPPDEPHDVVSVSRSLSARGQAVFPGRLDPTLLSFGERAMVTAMRAPIGDSRDPAAVRAWAEQVAGELAGRLAES